MLVVIGAVIALVGVVLIVAERFGLRLGRLPGDIAVERDRFKLYVPLGTSLILSVILSLVLWLVGRRG
jgi:hypothetical protein